MYKCVCKCVCKYVCKCVCVNVYVNVCVNVYVNVCVKVLYTPNDIIHKFKNCNIIFFKFTVSECNIHTECPADTALLSTQNQSCWHSHLNVTMGRKF